MMINYHILKIYTIVQLFNIVIEVYIWLSYKYEKEFVERELAQELKNRVCEIIENIIEYSDKAKKFNLI